MTAVASPTMMMAKVMYAQFPVEECDDGGGEWGHGHPAEVVARNDDAGHASHRVREPESDHLSGRQDGCSGKAGVDEGGEGVPVPEFGDEGSEGEADGDEDEGNEHDWADAEAVGPVSDDGCEDAGDEGEGEGEVEFGLVPSVAGLERTRELAERVLGHADGEAGREEYEEGDDVATVDAPGGVDRPRG